MVCNWTLSSVTRNQPIASHAITAILTQCLTFHLRLGLPTCFLALWFWPTCLPHLSHEWYIPHLGHSSLFGHEAPHYAIFSFFYYVFSLRVRYFRVQFLVKHNLRSSPTYFNINSCIFPSESGDRQEPLTARLHRVPVGLRTSRTSLNFSLCLFLQYTQKYTHTHTHKEKRMEIKSLGRFSYCSINLGRITTKSSDFCKKVEQFT